MVGWLKHFVHSRSLPSPSLIKGYNIHMLSVRAPSSIAHEYNRRFQTAGKDMMKRGHLILVPALMAARAQRPGCGLVNVIHTTRNTIDIKHNRLSQKFLDRFAAYNQTANRTNRFGNTPAERRSLRFNTLKQGNHTPTTHFVRIQRVPSVAPHAHISCTYNIITAGHPGVTINGHSLRVGHVLGVRAIINGTPIYGDVASVIYVIEHTTKFALFVGIQVRPVVQDKCNCALVKRTGGEIVWVEALSQLTHMVLFVDHSSQADVCVCVKVYATTPTWT